MDTYSDQMITFSRALSGKFSNKAQADKMPMKFAHINIYFRPLPWSLFKSPSFYSEQSYDYAPWNPYRQAILKLKIENRTLILENFGINSSERLAGGGFNKEVLNDLKMENLFKRKGCEMLFKYIKNDHYKGEIRPGRECLIKRGNKTTYLTSKVEINKEELTSIDKGFDVTNNEHIWGSENGPLKFKKITLIDQNIIRDWSNQIKSITDGSSLLTHKNISII